MKGGTAQQTASGEKPAWGQALYKNFLWDACLTDIWRHLVNYGEAFVFSFQGCFSYPPMLLYVWKTIPESSGEFSGFLK